LGSKGTWLSGERPRLVRGNTGVMATFPLADSAPVVKETNVQAYLDRVEKVEAEASTLLAKTLKLEEQRQLLEFKNRVLTEMVCFDATTALAGQPER